MIREVEAARIGYELNKINRRIFKAIKESFLNSDEYKKARDAYAKDADAYTSQGLKVPRSLKRKTVDYMIIEIPDLYFPRPVAATDGKGYTFYKMTPEDISSIGSRQMKSMLSFQSQFIPTDTIVRCVLIFFRRIISRV